VPDLARRLWQRYEPYHALTYFAHESMAAYRSAGLEGFWDGYFAGRAAPLGAVGAGTVAATFQGFSTPFVAKRVPKVWSTLTPAEAVALRLAGVDGAARRILGDEIVSGPVVEATELARRAVEACAVAGRPLFAANAELPWPEEPHLALWHATTLLREHRGDGHVVALTAAGLDACETHVVRIAAAGESRDWMLLARGWSEEDWDAAAERLRARGWLDGDGGLTAKGRAEHDGIEVLTDRLAQEPLERLGPDRCTALLAALDVVAAAVGAAGQIPYPNPIGLSAPE
jgi:hypothetical protein